MREFLFLSVAGTLAGVVNAFFGTGGGVILFFTLSLIGCDSRRSLATTNLVVGALSLISFFTYLKLGIVRLDESVLKILPAALLGGLLGAVLSGAIPSKLLKKVFSALVIFCGVRALL